VCRRQPGESARKNRRTATAEKGEIKPAINNKSPSKKKGGSGTLEQHLAKSKKLVLVTGGKKKLRSQKKTKPDGFQMLGESTGGHRGGG